MIDRQQVEYTLLLAQQDAVDISSEVVAELCKTWLALDSAPVVRADHVDDDDGITLTLAMYDYEEAARFDGKRVRIVPIAAAMGAEAV